MFCAKCGAEMPQNVKFCTKCGSAMPEIAPAPAAAPTQTVLSATGVPSAPKKSGGKILAVVAIVVGIVAIALAAVFLGRGAELGSPMPPVPTVSASQTPSAAPTVSATATPAPAVTPTPAPTPAMTEAEVMPLYEAVVLAEYSGEYGVLLVDLNHDGTKEMIVTHWGTLTAEGEAVFDLYTVRNGAVELVATERASDIHAESRGWTLYQSGDCGYLKLESYYVSGQSDGIAEAALYYLLGENGLWREATPEELKGVNLSSGITLIAPYECYLQNPYFEAAAGAGQALSAGEQGKINLFLSNFSEQSFGNFDRASYSDEQLIEFGFFQMERNGSGVITYRNDLEYIAADVVESAAQRFFGITPSRRDTTRLTYADGSYAYRELASGAPIALSEALFMFICEPSALPRRGGRR